MHTASIKSPVFQKWAAAVIMSSMVSFLFSTNISFIGYSYNVGDIAATNVTADQNITAEGKKIKKGETVGYDRTFRAQRPATIAILPVGYWDGYDRRLSNNGVV
ncbi:MAG: hypothetical protein HY265_01090, partial [Deltaproteobacteria bacterium]|nr:hypothetical protein [Deltaproteobacteria bacterium]